MAHIIGPVLVGSASDVPPISLDNKPCYCLKTQLINV